jgi:spore germination protein YaaH
LLRRIDAIGAYEQRHPGGPGGPVAGLPWVKACLAVALHTVPSSKLQLGEAGYGYRRYANGRAVTVGDAQARQVAERYGVSPVRDVAQGEWHVTLPDRSVMWWSDARCQALDTALASQAELRGTAVWQLVQSDPLSSWADHSRRWAEASLRFVGVGLWRAGPLDQRITTMARTRPSTGRNGALGINRYHHVLLSYT